jgi:hypothetical protein
LILPEQSISLATSRGDDDVDEQSLWRLTPLGLALAALSLGTAQGAEQAASPPQGAAPNPYPPVARALNLPGKASLACKATAKGELRDCRLLSEDPVEWGFGEAALTMAPSINVGRGDDSRPVDVPITFKLDPDLVQDPAVKVPGFVISPKKRSDWKQLPNADDFAGSYPDRAVQKRIEGAVTIACRVGSKGEMLACVFYEESPRGEGFIDAARYLASKFRLPPHLPDGTKVENGVFRTRLRWTFGGR